MKIHDELCPTYTYPTRPDACQCKIISEVRVKLSAQGWVAPEAHEAIVATAKARAVLFERQRISTAIEELPYNLSKWSKDIDGVVTLTRATAYGRVLAIVNDTE